MKSNREVLETVARYSYEEGLTPRLMPLEEIFAPSTLDLSAWPDRPAFLFEGD